MKPDDRTYHRVVRACGAFFRLWRYRFDVVGAEHLPASGPAVIASNHTGFLDFTFIGYAARERGRLVRFMAKRSVFDAPVAGWLMRRMGHVPVDRSAGAIAYRRAGRLLDAGELVGLFPEATISRSWLLKPFRPGAAGLAVSRGLPLIPVVVWGGHRILTVDGRRTFRRGLPITIRVGAPLLPAEGEGVAELNDRLRVAMTALLDDALDTYPDRPRSDSDGWWWPEARGGTAPDPVTAARLDREALERLGERLD